jgi:hypothetical protein
LTVFCNTLSCNLFCFEITLPCNCFHLYHMLLIAGLTKTMSGCSWTNWWSARFT